MPAWEAQLQRRVAEARVAQRREAPAGLMRPRPHRPLAPPGPAARELLAAGLVEARLVAAALAAEELAPAPLVASERLRERQPDETVSQAVPEARLAQGPPKAARRARQGWPELWVSSSG